MHNFFNKSKLFFKHIHLMMPHNFTAAINSLQIKSYKLIIFFDVFICYSFTSCQRVELKQTFKMAPNVKTLNCQCPFVDISKYPQLQVRPCLFHNRLNNCNINQLILLKSKTSRGFFHLATSSPNRCVSLYHFFIFIFSKYTKMLS